MLGIGDDMAIVRCLSGDLLLSSDMVLDGVHFRLDREPLELIGRKAIACGLSDCAAMAVRPLAATVSVALPADWTLEGSKRLYAGMKNIGEEFGCAIVGGDTTAWHQGLAIDVAIAAVPYEGITPVRRSGAKSGDRLFVTGRLGGSGLGRHLTFTPRIHEARSIAEAWADRLHAMIDLSDGLSLDLHRLCEASGVGATLDLGLLLGAIHPDAEQAARNSGRTPLQHALSDGEDFELLMAASPDAGDLRSGVELWPMGTVTESGMRIRQADGSVRPLERAGFEHLA